MRDLVVACIFLAAVAAAFYAALSDARGQEVQAPMVCAPTALVVEAFQANDYRLVWRGIDKDGYLWAIWEAPDGSWSEVMSSTGQITCLIEQGSNSLAEPQPVGREV